MSVVEFELTFTVQPEAYLDLACEILNVEELNDAQEERAMTVIGEAIGACRYLHLVDDEIIHAIHTHRKHIMVAVNLVKKASDKKVDEKISTQDALIRLLMTIGLTDEEIATIAIPKMKATQSNFMDLLRSVEELFRAYSAMFERKMAVKGLKRAIEGNEIYQLLDIEVERLHTTHSEKPVREEVKQEVKQPVEPKPTVWEALNNIAESINENGKMLEQAQERLAQQAKQFMDIQEQFRNEIKNN